MRIAVIYNDEDIFVEIKPKEFVGILARGLSKPEEEVARLMDTIIKDLKNRSKYE